jgi:cytochrome c-type biogenesis protein CcmE
MTAKTTKIGASAAAIVLALGGLMYTTLSDGTEYYKHVEEVMVEPVAWHGKRMSLHGFVVDQSIQRKPDTLEYLFTIESKGKMVQARYTGIVPDTFKHGSEVVVKGTLGPNGFTVEPNGVMAKCPSKYEPAKAAAVSPSGN